MSSERTSPWVGELSGTSLACFNLSPTLGFNRLVNIDSWKRAPAQKLVVDGGKEESNPGSGENILNSFQQLWQLFSNCLETGAWHWRSPLPTVVEQTVRRCVECWMLMDTLQVDAEVQHQQFEWFSAQALLDGRCNLVLHCPSSWKTNVLLLKHIWYGKPLLTLPG